MTIEIFSMIGWALAGLLIGWFIVYPLVKKYRNKR